MHSQVSDPYNAAPTCGAVTQKQGGSDAEIICGKPATTLYSISDPDDGVRVQAIILLCDDCTHRLESGILMVFKAEDGGHIAVQLPGENHDANESTTTIQPADDAGRTGSAGQGSDKATVDHAPLPGQEDGRAERT